MKSKINIKTTTIILLALVMLLSPFKKSKASEVITYPVSTGEIIANFNSGKDMVKLNMVVTIHDENYYEKLSDKTYLLRDIIIKEVGTWQVDKKEDIDVEEFKETVLNKLSDALNCPEYLFEGAFLYDYIVVP